MSAQSPASFPGPVVALILGAILYWLRSLHTAVVVREEIVWKKYRNMGCDFVVLGTGACVGVIARFSEKGLLDQIVIYNLFAVLFFFGVWATTYGFCNPSESRERLGVVQWVWGKFPNDDELAKRRSWAMRFWVGLTIGLLSYFIQVRIALM